MSLNLEHASPTKGNYEADEPDPEENLSDNSFEQSKHIPHTNLSKSTAHPVQNPDMNGPIDPSGRKQQHFVEPGDLREKQINQAFSGQKVASGKVKPSGVQQSQVK